MYLENYFIGERGKRVTINSHKSRDPYKFGFKLLREGIDFTVPVSGYLLWSDGSSVKCESGEVIKAKTVNAEILTMDSSSSSANNVGKFLSSVDTLKDPLPLLRKLNIVFERNVVIDNPDFKEENGVFTVVDFSDLNELTGLCRLSFMGSTFKIAPRIFSARLLYNLEYFGNDDGVVGNGEGVFTPFWKCPNVESVRPQGGFGPALKFLGPCDFSVVDRETGIADASGWPICEPDDFKERADDYGRLIREKKVDPNIVKENESAPLTVLQFMAVPEGVLDIGTVSPSLLNCKRVKNLIYPIHAQKAIINTVNAPQLPLAGLDMYEHNMDGGLLSFSPFPIELSTDYRDGGNNVAFTLAHLGVTMPTGHYDVDGFFCQYTTIEMYSDESKPKSQQTTSMQDRKLLYLTPDTLKTKVHYAWGAELSRVWKAIPRQPENDFFPELRGKIDELLGHFMHNVFSGYTPGMSKESTATWVDTKGVRRWTYRGVQGTIGGVAPKVYFEANPGDIFNLARWPEKDGEYFIPDIPQSLNYPIKNVTNWCRQLYSYCVIDKEVNVPSCPVSKKSLFNYYGTFAYTSGTKSITFDELGTDTTFASIVSDGEMASEYGFKPRVLNESQTRKLLAEAQKYKGSSLSFYEKGENQEVLNAMWEDGDNMGFYDAWKFWTNQKLDANFSVPEYYDYPSGANATFNGDIDILLTQYKEEVNLKNPPDVRMFKYPVNYVETYLPESPQQISIGHAQKMFFYSEINPEIGTPFIPLNKAMGQCKNSGFNYDSCYELRPVARVQQEKRIYTLYIETEHKPDFKFTGYSARDEDKDENGNYPQYMDAMPALCTLVLMNKVNTRPDEVLYETDNIERLIDTNALAGWSADNKDFRQFYGMQRFVGHSKLDKGTPGFMQFGGYGTTAIQTMSGWNKVFVSTKNETVETPLKKIPDNYIGKDTVNNGSGQTLKGDRYKIKPYITSTSLTSIDGMSPGGNNTQNFIVDFEELKAY